MIRPGRLLWLVQRDLKRGLAATFNDYQIAPRIWNRAPVAQLEQPAGSPGIHVVGGTEQFNLAGWMLASWFHHTGRNWKLTLHDDGSLTDLQLEKFARCYPGARICRRPDSDELVESALGDYPECWKARQHYAPSLKFFDAALIAGDAPFIVLDTDLLFYATPTSILEWVDGGCQSGSYFMRDLDDAYITDADECSEKFGLRLWPAVNSGICLVEGGSIDFDFTERFLRETRLLERPGWTHEQTLFAVTASHRDRGGHLDCGAYELTLAPTRSASACCRHYVGRVRDRFYSEGVATLKNCLLA